MAKKIIFLRKKILVFFLLLSIFFQWFFIGKFPGTQLSYWKNFSEPEVAEAKYQWTPSGGSIVVGSDYPVQDAIGNTPSWRALLSDDSWYWVTKFNLDNGLEKIVYIDGVRLQGANKLIITYGGYVSDSAGNYYVQIYDYANSTWRNLNWRDVAFSNTSDTNYTFEVYNGYWQSGGDPIDTPLSNFVSNDSNKRVQIRVYSTTTGQAILHYWDRLHLEVAIDPVVYANSLVRLNGWNGTITNNYTWTNYADDSRLIASNVSSGTPLDFYLSFKNVKTYPGANAIFVHHQGSVSNSALTYRLQIYNFASSTWENLNATLLSNTSETDYYFVKNNVNLSNYVSSGEVRIRYYTTTNNTYTLSIDLVYIFIGSVNEDTNQCQVSFGNEAGGTTCANTRDIDTSNTTDSTWQQTTATSASAGYYPGDYAGTWGTNHSASANLWVPITIPQNSAVTAIKYAARFRSNSSSLRMMPCLKDLSGLNPSVGGTGYTATGGWVDVPTYNESTAYTVLAPYAYTHYTSPEDFIDTHNNRANFRMRTSSSSATSPITRDWDFAMLSIRWIEDDTLNANNPQYVPTSGSLATGTVVAVGATNPASYTATFASDNYYWANQNTSSGLDVRINIDGVNLNNANKMIITYEGYVSNSALTYYLQIWDNVNSVWRTLNDREAALSNTSDTSYYFSIFNGFFTSTTTNGGDPLDTPLSNFVTQDSNKRVQIRIYSPYTAATYTHYLDRIQIEVATDPVFWPKDFERTQGTGTITNNYKFTHPAATLAITTGGSDDQRLTVANSDPACQFHFDFGNIQTYNGANAILVYYEGYTSATTNPYRLRIYNFAQSTWEDLTSSSLTSTSETAYQFAKAPVNISDYLNNNTLRIGFYCLTTNTGTLYIDYIYVTIGTVISNASDAEITFGQTAAGSSPLSTQDLDSTLSSPSSWQIQTSATPTNPYAQDYAGLVYVNQQAVANINFNVSPPTSTAVTGIRYALRFSSGSTYQTWQGYLKDYSGLTGTVGGWLLIGSNNAVSTYTFTEGWQELTFRNAEDFIDTFQNKINIKIKPTTNTLGTQINSNWDFAFVSIRWYENSANSYYNYQLTPTGSSLNYGEDLPVQQAIQNVGSYKAIFASDNQRWVIKNDPNAATTSMDVRINVENVNLPPQANKIWVTFEGLTSDSSGTFYLQIWDNSSSTWRTLNDREVAIGPTNETTYTYEVFNGRWQSGGVTIDTPLSNFIDSENKVQFRIYSTVTGRAFAVQIDRLQVRVETDSLYWAGNFTKTVGGSVTNDYTFTFTSDNNRLSVANTAGQSFDYYLSFKNVVTYQGANAIFVQYEGLTSVASLTYRLKIYNFAQSTWEDLTTTNLNNTSETTYYFGRALNLSDYISNGEIRIGFYTTATTSGTHSIDYLYIIVGSVIDDPINAEISFGSEAGGTSATGTQDLDTTLTSGENYWGIATALTSTNPYAGDFAGTYGTNDNGAANISFPVTPPSGSKITAVRYVARYLSNSSNNTIEYAIQDYSGLLGTAGGWYDPGSVGNNSTSYSLYILRYTTNPEDFVNSVTNKMNMKIRTTASTDSTIVTYKWDFAFASISWQIDENHPTFSHQLTPTGGSLATGTPVAIGGSPVNVGSWRGALASDNYYWANQNTSSGLDVRINIDGVNLNNANKMIITYEGYVSNSALTYYLQIWDNVNSVWRTLNDREAALSNTSDTSYYFSIFNGFFTSTTTNGGDPLDTPLSNFVTQDSNKRVQIRIYSPYTAATYTHYLDRIQIEVATDPVFWPKDFERTQGTGTITNNYKFTHPAATLAITTGGSDDQRLTVANSDPACQFHFDFGNIQTYNGANAILVYYEGYTSATTNPYRLRIYNFAQSTWEDLTSSSLTSTSETAYQFAKAPVNISDYLNNNTLRIGFYCLTTNTGTLYIDYIYVTIGTVISNASDAEITFGSSNGSSPLNTQDLDTTLTNPNVYGINTAVTSTNHYANDYPAGLYNVSQAGAANINFQMVNPNGTFLTALRFAARYRSNSTLLTVRTGTFDYSGIFGTTGGWYEQGTANNSNSFTFTEGWHYGTYNNASDFIDDLQGKTNLRLRTTASKLVSQLTIEWDFAMVSLRWTGAPVGVTISGAVYTDEGSTPIGSGRIVRIKVNGAGDYSTSTDANGNYSIPVIISAVGDVVTVFLDGATEKAVTVTRASSTSANITGLDLYQNRIIVRHEDSGPITIADLDKYDSEQDPDILFTASSTAGTLTASSTSELFIWSGKTFGSWGAGGVGGTISLADVDINGTFTATGTQTISVSGNWDATGGTFNSASSTVEFIGASAKNITTNGNPFYNLIFNGSGGSWTFQDAATTTNDLQISAGTVSSNYDIRVYGGDVYGNGVLNWTNGTFYLIGTGDFGGNSEWNFYNLSFGDGSLSATTTVIANNAINVNGNLTISNNHTLIASSDSQINLAGNWSNFGNFVHSSGTINFVDSAKETVISGSTKFYNLTCTTSKKTLKFSAGSSATTTIEGSLTINGSDCNNKIYLRSNTEGSHWYINVLGTSNINYVDVKDSYAITPLTAYYSTDSGNNTNWTIYPCAAVGPIRIKGSINLEGGVRLK
jgi:hypothetical protein